MMSPTDMELMCRRESTSSTSSLLLPVLEWLLSCCCDSVRVSGGRTSGVSTSPASSATLVAAAAGPAKICSGYDA